MSWLIHVLVRYLSCICIERFMKALFTRTEDVQDLITELQEITTEEDRLTIAEIIVGMHAISSDCRSHYPQ